MKTSWTIAAIVLVSFFSGVLVVVFVGSGNDDNKEQVEKTDSAKTDVHMPQNLEPRLKMASTINNMKLGNVEKRISEIEKKMNDRTDSETKQNHASGVALFKERMQAISDRNDRIRVYREATIDRIFASNEHDEEWESSIKTQIGDIMQTEEMKSNALLKIDCRSNLCEMVISHDDEESQREFADLFSPPASMLWGRPGANEDSQLTTQIYLVRKGHSVFAESDREAIQSLEIK